MLPTTASPPRSPSKRPRRRAYLTNTPASRRVRSIAMASIAALIVLSTLVLLGLLSRSSFRSSTPAVAWWHQPRAASTIDAALLPSAPPTKPLPLQHPLQPADQIDTNVPLNSMASRTLASTERQCDELYGLSWFRSLHREQHCAPCTTAASCAPSQQPSVPSPSALRPHHTTRDPTHVMVISLSRALNVSIDARTTTSTTSCYRASSSMSCSICRRCVTPSSRSRSRTHRPIGSLHRRYQ